jgi:acyl phosphate:glycerol-3-phosphate acyltransferase
MTLHVLLQAVLLGYLLGSFPSGFFFGWLSGAGDVRKVGSGNIGATNVLRTGKKWAAAATLFCDAAKGGAAALAACMLLPPGAEIIAGLAAVLGHLFPVWLKFVGGKGVATALGVFIALYWPAGLLVAATWIGAAVIWRISSLSALIAFALAPAYFLLLHHPAHAAFALLLSAIITFKHRDNIRRLLHGEEPRIGAKSSRDGTPA